MFTLLYQDVKDAILQDITKIGKEAGLKSFEQVSTLISTCTIINLTLNSAMGIERR